jgi:hypothetical protein
MKKEIERTFPERLSFAPATICHIAIMLFPAYHGRGIVGDMENSFPKLRKFDQKF